MQQFKIHESVPNPKYHVNVCLLNLRRIRNTTTRRKIKLPQMMFWKRMLTSGSSCKTRVGHRLICQTPFTRIVCHLCVNCFCFGLLGYHWMKLIMTITNIMLWSTWKHWTEHYALKHLITERQMARHRTSQHALDDSSRNRSWIFIDLQMA